MNKPQIKITSRRQNLEKAEKNIKPIHSNFLITLNLNQQYHKDEHKANLEGDMSYFDDVINKFLNSIENFIRLPSGVQYNDDTVKDSRGLCRRTWRNKKTSSYTYHVKN